MGDSKGWATGERPVLHLVRAPRAVPKRQRRSANGAAAEVAVVATTNWQIAGQPSEPPLGSLGLGPVGRESSAPFREGVRDGGGGTPANSEPASVPSGRAGLVGRGVSPQSADPR